jgi:hypothetical protein
MKTDTQANGTEWTNLYASGQIIFNNSAKAIQWINKWYWKNWTAICRRMNPYLGSLSYITYKY